MTQLASIIVGRRCVKTRHALVCSTGVLPTDTNSSSAAPGTPRPLTRSGPRLCSFRLFCCCGSHAGRSPCPASERPPVAKTGPGDCRSRLRFRSAAPTTAPPRNRPDRPSYRENNRHRRYQDGRKLRRYKRRWIVECTNAWLGQFRRLLPAAFSWKLIVVEILVPCSRARPAPKCAACSRRGSCEYRRRNIPCASALR